MHWHAVVFFSEHKVGVDKVKANKGKQKSIAFFRSRGLHGKCHHTEVSCDKVVVAAQQGGCRVSTHAWPFDVEFACSACVCVGSLPGCFSFLPQSKHMDVRLIENSEFSIAVTTSAPFLCGPVVNGPNCKCKWNCKWTTAFIRRQNKKKSIQTDWLTAT